MTASWVLQRLRRYHEESQLAALGEGDPLEKMMDDLEEAHRRNEPRFRLSLGVVIGVLVVELALVLFSGSTTIAATGCIIGGATIAFLLRVLLQLLEGRHMMDMLLAAAKYDRSALKALVQIIIERAKGRGSTSSRDSGK